MDNIMAVTLNGVAQLEYNRNRALPPQQELYLDKMDQKMDDGIFVGDATIPNPDINQRAQFVAGNLAHAILSDDEAMCSALTAYLASRLPELKQVKITNNKTENNTADEASDAVSIELVFDEEYQKQVAVKFLH
jgi:xanthine dehydrogenase iron-sulfur cluster and FAD-binding subunit A